MTHKHGPFFMARTRLALALLPKCVRAEIEYRFAKDKIARAIGGLVFGNVAEQDQAAATLRDLGKNTK